MNRVSAVPDLVRISNVLISVSDKRELEGLIPALLSIDDLVIHSTGGTYDRIRATLKSGQYDRLRKVSDYTGQPEMQGGLVKTLDYKIYLGLLSEPGNADHASDRDRVGAKLIDMVVVNLYPFRSIVHRPDADLEDARSNIDIGGPCMLRAAAKSFLRVAAVCDPADYQSIGDEMKASNGQLTLATRYRLAQKAFGHTSQYDRAIADYLSEAPFDRVSSTYDFTLTE